jgi:hypothetical protein
MGVSLRGPGGRNRADFGASLSASGLGASTSQQLQPGQTLASHHRSRKYTPIVNQLNLARKASPPIPYPLLNSYAGSLSSATADASTAQQGANPLLAQSFSLLARIVGEGQPGVGERSWAARSETGSAREERTSWKNSTSFLCFFWISSLLNSRLILRDRWFE